MEKYGWKNIWSIIDVNCPWCNAYQKTKYVTEKCFYCSKLFFVGVDGKVEKINSK